jgi:hypothetical protein
MDNVAIRQTDSIFAMKRLATCSLLLLSLLGSVGGAWAQASWRDLPPEERRQMRQQMREHWRQEHDLQREEMRRDEFRREEPPPRWRDLPIEDRRRLRDEMREQRGMPPHPEHRGGGRGWRPD